jgi:methylase of polypeptide subunit release factors
MLGTGITYEGLLASFRKGLRNGNWRHLNPLDKALYRASLWYAKRRGSIVNTSLVEKLLGLVERLKETKGMRIFERGFKKAAEMLDKGEETGVFVWVPRLRHWLRDPDYIFWLGTVR